MRNNWRLLLLLLCLSWLVPACSDDSASGGDDAGDTSLETDSDVDEPGSVWVTLSEEDSRGAFLSAWGPAPDEVYIAGGQPDGGIPGNSEGVLLRWDGSALRSVNFGFDVPLLNWVYGVDDELWVVGDDGFAAQRVDGEWVDRSTPVPEPLWGVWGASSDDLWAVGGEDDVSVVLRWNGTEWREIDIPATGRTAGALFKVWGTAADNVYIVGARGIILHWNGETLTEESFDELRSDLVSLWGVDEDTIMISGGRGNGVVVFRDGEGWQSSGVLPVPGLSGTWVSGEQMVGYSVGDSGTIIRFDLETQARTPERSGASSMILHGVFGFEGGPLFVVGGTLGGAPPWEGIILTRPEF